jgi:hypothetical protein
VVRHDVQRVVTVDVPRASTETESLEDHPTLRGYHSSRRNDHHHLGVALKHSGLLLKDGVVDQVVCTENFDELTGCLCHRS